VNDLAQRNDRRHLTEQTLQQCGATATEPAQVDDLNGPALGHGHGPPTMWIRTALTVLRRVIEDSENYQRSTSRWGARCALTAPRRHPAAGSAAFLRRGPSLRHARDRGRAHAGRSPASRKRPTGCTVPSPPTMRTSAHRDAR